MSAVHVIGDVHGELAKLRDLLRGAGLIDASDRWAGADSTLWFMGDLVDHGPDGVGVVELVMRLQTDAARAGGRIDALIGNHDILLLSAYLFGPLPVPGRKQTFREAWRESDGRQTDLERLSAGQVHWLSERPAMARVADHLLIHGDALLYMRYGRSVPEVNRAVSELLAGEEPLAWFQLLQGFEEHHAFADAANGTARAEALLGMYGGRQIVHGHTPISKLTGQPPETVREPLVYAESCCVDVDPGMYLGGSGFAYRLGGPT